MDVIINSINRMFAVMNVFLDNIFFFDVLFFIDAVQLPLVIFVLSGSGLFLTFKMNFVNVRFFRHAFSLLFRSVKTNKNSLKKPGDISSFKALTTALSATVGLGNIAGVAIAVSTGGPGAVFWMLVMGFFGMSVKFTECSLSVMFRKKRADGSYSGGPMYYLQQAFSDASWPRFGKFLAVTFAILCMGGNFGAGMAFQVNQSLNAIAISVPMLQDAKWLYAAFMIILVALVIFGGIKRIADVASRIVPSMFVIYVLMALVVLFMNYEKIPETFVLIFREAFNPQAAYGGFFGVLIIGFQRAAFSNESGLGSSPIVHSVAKVDHPIEQGSMSLLEPFFDTIIICTMTALVILVTGVYADPKYAELAHEGAALTSQALAQVNMVFPYILSVSVFLFAFSTIISSAYYGEKCFAFLFKNNQYLFIYKYIVLVMIFLGALATSKEIMIFCDSLLLSMCLPNLIGVLFLSGKVKNSMKNYEQNIKQ